MADAPHVIRYVTRLDSHLATFTSDDGRRVFLESERAKWLVRYSDWQWRVDAGKETNPDHSAFDFISTLAAIDARLNRLEIARAA